MSKEEILLKTIRGGKGVKKMTTSETSCFLKGNRVDLNIQDSHGYNMLHWAIKSENPELVSLFLSLDEETYLTEKASPNIQTSDENKEIFLSPILLALQSVNDSQVCSKIIKTLVKSGCDISKKDEEGCSLFLRACEKGKIDILYFLINSDNINFGINETCSNGSALHLAIIGDQEEVISFLLNNNIDVSLLDSNNNTALHFALQLKMNNAFKLIQDFIINSPTLTDEQKKTLFNAQNEDGNTILHELAYAKCHFMIEMIKKYPSQYSIDLEIKNKDGNTYKRVQENIVQLQKDKENREKMIKEEIRKQKERIAEEKLQEKNQEKELIEKMKIAAEKREKTGEFMLKYRWVFFGMFFIVFMTVLYLLVNNATKKKAKIIY